MKLPSASEIKRKGDAYFRSRRTVRTDKNGLPVRDDEGNILFGSDAPYTVTGYAEAIGLGTVEELFVFPDEERQLLVKKALLRIEAANKCLEIHQTSPSSPLDFLTMRSISSLRIVRTVLIKS